MRKFFSVFAVISIFGAGWCFRSSHSHVRAIIVDDDAMVDILVTLSKMDQLSTSTQVLDERHRLNTEYSRLAMDAFYHGVTSELTLWSGYALLLLAVGSVLYLSSRKTCVTCKNTPG